MHNFNTVLNLLEPFEIKDFLSLNLSILNKTKTFMPYFGQFLITIFIVGSALILYSII